MADPNVFRQYLQPLRSVSDYIGDADRRELAGLQLEGQRGQNALLALTRQQQAEQARQGIARQNALQALLADPANANPEAVEAAMLRNPLLMQEGLARQKQRVDIANTQSQIGERTATTKKTTQATQEAARAAAIQQVASLGSPQEAIQLLQAKVQAGEVPQELAQPLAALVQNDPKWQLKLIIGISNPEKMVELLRPIIQTRNTGATTDTLAVDPITGQPQVTGSVRNTMSPDAVASNQVARGNLALSRERLAFDKSQPKGVLDTERGLLVDPRSGEGRPVTVGGVPVGVKPDAATKKELTSINQQESIINGAIDAAKATPSAFGMGRGLATMAGGVSESVAGRFDSSDERQARAYVFNNVSKVINERAGAAQSAQELARLRGFLPAETDTSEQVVDKMEAFKLYLADMRAGTTPNAKRIGGSGGSWDDADPLGLRK